MVGGKENSKGKSKAAFVQADRGGVGNNESGMGTPTLRGGDGTGSAGHRKGMGLQHSQDHDGPDGR